MFRLNENKQLMQYDQCLFDRSDEIHLTHCAAGDLANWEFDEDTRQLIYGKILLNLKLRLKRLVFRNSNEYIDTNIHIYSQKISIHHRIQ